MTQKTQTQSPQIRVGSIITFTNKVNYKVKLVVSRVEEKSWYVGTGRNSYGTLIGYTKYPDFKIIF